MCPFSPLRETDIEAQWHLLVAGPTRTIHETDRIRAEVDSHRSRVEDIRRYRILAHELDRYRDIIDEMHTDA